MKKQLICVAIVVLALSICIGFASCSNDEKAKDKDTTKVEYIEVTDENGKLVTNKDGSAVTETTVVTVASTDKEQSKKETTKDSTTKSTTNKDSSTTTTKKNEKSTTKKEEKTTKKQDKTTTTTTLHYTTTNSLDNNLGEEISLDEEYALTANGAMSRLQNRYDSNTYVVNLIEETSDYATLYVFVLENNDIYSKAKVNLKNGKTSETITKTGKKLTYTL